MTCLLSPSLLLMTCLSVHISSSSNTNQSYRSAASNSGGH
uniref:Uncharacterized protein n=1 Tax=Arundo donax TaxID=35708 RepID=A0A0A9HGE7_ARUDO